MLKNKSDCVKSGNKAISSVRRSSPRTGKGPRTGPDRTDLGPDHGPGPCLFKEFAVWSYYFQPDLRTDKDRSGLVQTEDRSLSDVTCYRCLFV